VYLGVGVGNGNVETCQKLCMIAGHQAQIDGTSISLAQPAETGASDVMMYGSWTYGGVWRLKWREDGELLASGRTIMSLVWDGRVEDVGGEAGRESAK